MKKILFIILISFSFIGYAQVPNLDLRNEIKGPVSDLPQRLNQNEICLIYEINGGWSAYDFIYYYFIKKNGELNIYQEEQPHTYVKNDQLKRTVKTIEPTPALKDKIITLINSELLSELLKYKQEDFRIKIPELKDAPPMCRISDQNDFKLTLIQNDRQSSYHYYAPRYYYENCPDKRINKPILKKLIDVLDLFR
ncbi:hypothetical protein [Chryseobacterium sp. BIGb0232]|uniref:hypothetical protein n=1 Tax=Chryseobacterium sp. BIGb0232 TaxID=2940598 RepID=UPI000F45FF11|nr:hypothetical protein [Chryseobacterium sp. BIGb0232]MCS4303294.1 hypothetical protein [Chryseobacterium sp. BIGb0232]ROS11432.1 hypothetical protein EDF65_3844 [Chryseobacterium nakagawai]